MTGRFEYVDEAPQQQPRYEWADDEPKKKDGNFLAKLPPLTPAMLAGALMTEEGRENAANALIGGPLRGALRIGDTVLGAKAALEDKLYEAVRGKQLSDLVAKQPAPFGQAHKDRMESAQQFFAENFDPESGYFTAGDVGAQIAGTAGAGQVVAGAMRAAPIAAPAWQALANSVASGGMTTGANMGRVANMATRVGGGAISGGAMVGMVDPENAHVGAVIGGVLPPVLQGLHATLGGAGRAIHSMRAGPEVRAARDIASMSGAKTTAQVQALRDALRQQGPEIIPGQRSIPEILQTPEMSQLQRSLQAVQPAPFVARSAEREAARREVLERIAPLGNPREVAEEVGNTIREYAIPQHQAAKAAVRAKFGAVDPFNESRVILPIDELQAAKDKFLGPGTFGSGGSAQQAIAEAERIGTIPLPGIKAATSPVRKQPQTLVQAVRKMGGINPNSAGGMNQEIAEFGRRQSGTTGLVSARGKTIDQVAELMHERGFIASPDPSDLLDAMRASQSGRPVYAADVADDAFRARFESAMGDAPEAGRVLKPVSFEELQSLRSSIGEQWRAASRAGNAKEAAALDAQRRAIDGALDNLAAGRGQPGEFFDSQMVSAYRDARGAHAAKQQRFMTGPQAKLFRDGSDGLPQLQGGEVPRAFFSGRPSQVSDAQSFRRLVQDDQRLMNDLRRFAVSDLASQTKASGELSAAKFNRWLTDRAGATGEAFTPQQRAWLKSIAEDLQRSAVAENLGRSTGSDTTQKAASVLRLGLADNPGSRWLAGRIPGGNLAMDFLTGPARTAKAERLGGLLNDPERTAGLLDVFIATQQPRAVTGLLGADPLLTRSAPALLTAPNR